MTASASAADAPPRIRPNLGGLAWLGVVAAGLALGTWHIADDRSQLAGAAPFIGRWTEPQYVRELLPAALFAGLVVSLGPTIVRRLAARHVPVAAGLAASTWTVALAMSQGWERIAEPLGTRFEYEGLASTIDDPIAFLDSYVATLPDYPIHVQGHPPAATLAYWLLDLIGLGGIGWAAALMIGAWGVAVASALVAHREIAGDDHMRRAAPFLALAPAALWAGTSTDPLFAGFVATGIAIVAVATSRRGRSAFAMAAAGGVVLALSLYLTYGAVPLLAVPAAIVVYRRRWDLIAPSVIGALAVTGAFTAAGFWWFDGLDATRTQYELGVGSRRSWTYFVLVGNLAAFGLAVGPGPLAGLRRGAWAVWLLPLAGITSLLIANFSGLSKAEVERIWLIFVPWVALSAGAVPWEHLRRWLAPSAAIGLVLQSVLISPW